MLFKHMIKHIEHNLNNIAKPTPLSARESMAIWRKTAASLNVRRPHGHFYSLTYKPMYAIIVAITLLVGGSGATVAAANNARPGDLLFKLDTAVERVQMAVAKQEKKVELRAKFAAERAAEAEELIEEVDDAQKKQMAEISTSTKDNTDGTDEEDEEPSTRASFAAKHAIDKLAEVKIELEAKGNDVAANAIAETIIRLETKLERLPEQSRARVFIDNDGNRIKVRIKDENRIGNESRDVKDEEKTEETMVITDIDVTVRGDIAYVKVTYSNGRKQEYQTTFASRVDIIASIANKLDVNEQRVENYLKLKYEDVDDNDTNENSDSGENDESSIIDDLLSAPTVRKIEVNMNGDVAKVEATYSNGREKEFRIEGGAEAEMNANIAEKLGISAEVASALTVYKR